MVPMISVGSAPIACAVARLPFGSESYRIFVPRLESGSTAIVAMVSLFP